MRRSDLRLVPAAGCLWVLAVLGITVGSTSALTGAVVLLSLALTAVVALGRRPAAAKVLAHTGILLLAAVLLLPALQRHTAVRELLADADAQGAVLEIDVVLRADPAVPTSGPDWSRTGQQAMARTVRGEARIGARTLHLPSSLPVLLRASGEGGTALATARDGDRVQVRGTVRVRGGLIVLRAGDLAVVPRTGVGGALQDVRHDLRAQARERTAHLPADEAALVRGMTSGDTTGMGERAQEMMRRAGISHLVAVPGAIVRWGYG